MTPFRTGSPFWVVAFLAGLLLAGWSGVSGRGGVGAWVAALALAVGLWHHGRAWRMADREVPEAVPTASGWEEVEALLQERRAVLFKHSPICPVSARAAGQVSRFARDHPGVPVVRLDVLAGRALSDRIAGELGVVHESPQALILGRGRVREVLNHGAVRAQRLEEAVAAAGE